MKSGPWRMVLIVLGAAVLLLLAWIWVALSWSYADGERAAT